MKPAQALSLVMFREYYSIRRFLGTNYNKSKLKSIGMIFVILYALGTVLFGFGYLFFELGKILEVAQLLPILLGFIFFYVSALSIMYVMFRADGYLFHFKDYELIAPLPISPLNIVIIKMKLMLLMLYIMSFFMILPIAFSYFYFQGFDMLSFLFLLGSFIVIPLIPTVLFSLVSIIFQRITQQFRQSKIVSIVLWLILTVFLLVGSFAFSFDGDNPLMGQQTMITWFLNNYPLANWFIEAIVDHNVISFLLLISTSVFPFILFIVLVSKVVVRLNESGKNIKTQTTNKQATFQKRSLFQSMFLKEIRKFFSVPIYALNTGIGLIMLLMISVGMIAFRQDVMLYLDEIFQLSSFSAEAVSVILIGFCIGMVYTSAISLSLEGKQFWIIKSLPIDAKKVMLAKIAFNIFLQLSIGLVGTILLGIGLQLSIWSILALLLFTISYSIFSSIAYAWVNLFLPKFDFINETEVVKQSLASLVSIFGGFATIALIVWGIIELSVISNPGLAVFLFALLIIALSTLLYRVVMVFCERVFTKLQA